MSEPHESVASAAQPLNTLEAEAIATLGYIYGYPLVLMDATRAVSAPPVNRFTHLSDFPDDTFTDVVSPNVDTLYSIAWLDLGKEPIVLAVPDLGRRYYTMQLLDAWTNVIAAPGTRTTGNGKGAFAIVGPGWRGDLPLQCRGDPVADRHGLAHRPDVHRGQARLRRRPRDPAPVPADAARRAGEKPAP